MGVFLLHGNGELGNGTVLFFFLQDIIMRDV